MTARPDLITQDWEGVQRNFDALARLRVQQVTALPTRPFDTQTVDYVADAANGVVWRLRYRQASTSTYKWEFAGGSWLSDQQRADETFNNYSTATWGAVSANDPTVTLPLAGDYLVDNRCSLLTTAAATVRCGVKVGATEPPESATGYNAVASARQSLAEELRLNGQAASTVLTQRYWHNGGAGVNLSRMAAVLKVQPVRVG